MRNTFLLCLAAFSLPLSSQAQGTAPPHRHVYVGLGANLGTYWLKWGGGYIREPFSFSPTLAVGVTLKDNWALQARVSTYEQQSSNSFFFRDNSPGPRRGQTRYVATTYRNKIVVVPLLLRRTLKKQATRPLQADALLGLRFLASRVRSSGLTSDSTNTIISSSSDGESTLNTSLTLGAGLRYALTPRVELATELLTSIHFVPYFFKPNYNAQLELRYRFGL